MRFSAFGFLCALSLCVSGCPKSPLAQSGDAGDASTTASTDGATAEAGSADVSPTPSPLADGGWDEGVMPPIASEELTQRMKHLVEAIGHDNADLAADVLFPRDAFVQVKDASDPGKAWEKLRTAFGRAVHVQNSHKKGMEKATLVSFELGHSVNLVPAKRREFKRALWRAKHSKLIFAIDGKTSTMEIIEMTAWHGNWYITKLR